MNDLFEKPARPILTGMLIDQWPPLNPNQQVLVAGWMAKVAFLNAMRDGSSSWQNAHNVSVMMQDLLRKGEPPIQTSVRIGRIDPAPRPRTTPRLKPLLPAALPRYELKDLSSMGHLFFEVVVGDVPNISRFVRETPNNECLLRVWPPSPATLGRAPTEILDPGDVAIMSLRWNAIRPMGAPAPFVTWRGWEPKPADPRDSTT